MVIKNIRVMKTFSGTKSNKEEKQATIEVHKNSIYG